MALDVCLAVAATTVIDFISAPKIPGPEPINTRVPGVSQHFLWRREISLGSRAPSSISYPVWKMTCQGDLGLDENKIRILMSRSLGGNHMTGFLRI